MFGVLGLGSKVLLYRPYHEFATWICVRIVRIGKRCDDVTLYYLKTQLTSINHFYLQFYTLKSI